MSAQRLAVVVLLLSLPRFLLAQESSPSDLVVEEPSLVDLGAELQNLDFLNNVYQRADNLEVLREVARSFEGKPIEIEVTVDRVSHREVILEYRDKGRIRIVFEHLTPPRYGNLGTVYYRGTSGARRANLHSAPFALRIGSEIDLELAKRLRQGDRLIIRGTIGSLPIKHEGFFNSQGTAIVRDWSVVGPAD